MSATGYFEFTSASVGAPTLNNVAGALITCLDKALDVTNPSSYWQKVFSGTNKAVYRATTGERRYFRVDDSGTTSAQIRAYESMTDVDTGTDPFPTLAQRIATAWIFYKSNSATARSWRCVGDSRYFAFTNEPEGTVTSCKCIFGEANNHDPLDLYPTMICAGFDNTLGSSGGASLTGQHLEMNPNNPTVYYARSENGAIKSCQGFLRAAAATSAGGDLSKAPVLPIRPVTLHDTKNSGGTGTLAYERGTLPYLYYTGYVASTAVLPLVTPVVYGGKTYRPLCGDTSNNPLLLQLASNDEVGRV